MANPPALGAGDRRFKSDHPDGALVIAAAHWSCKPVGRVRIPYAPPKFDAGKDGSWPGLISLAFRVQLPAPQPFLQGTNVGCWRLPVKQNIAGSIPAP